MKMPDKCRNCPHTIVRFEEVHEGWCKYYIDWVVRCDCFPAHYIVGCVCAEVYCKNKQKAESEDI